LECDVSGGNKHWRKVYTSARQELDPARQVDLCKKARSLMQRRMVDLASDGRDVAEQAALEEALRDLWAIERGTQTPDVQ
jgi:hypothetical protein